MADLIQIENPDEPGTLRPRLRPLEASVVEEDGRELLVLADPLHLVEDAVALPSDYLPLLQMLDGSQTLDQLASLAMQETGDLQAGPFLRRLVAKLDELLLLDSPRFHEAWRGLREAYRAQPTRETALAGISYPAEPAELREFLRGLQQRAREGAAPSGGLAAGAASADAPPAGALVVPHIDLRRGGEVMAGAYLEWADAVPRLVVPGAGERPAEIVMAFGTGHSVLGSLAVLTRKDFETPLGPVPACRAVVDALAAELGEEMLGEEIAHRDEHSLEFQALFLAEMMERGARFEMVPLLCGSFAGYLAGGTRPADDPEVERLVDALRRALRAAGRPVRFVAGVDLSHAGRRFGDEWDPTEENLKKLEEQDRAVVDAALTGEADRWFEAIAAQGDSTHICGFSAVYLMLRTMGGGRGRLLEYEQSPEPETQSVVTYASIAYDVGGLG
jgi:hypothetical protein